MTKTQTWYRVLGFAAGGLSAYHLYTGMRRPSTQNFLAGVFEIAVATTFFKLSGALNPISEPKALQNRT